MTSQIKTVFFLGLLTGLLMLLGGFLGGRGGLFLAFGLAMIMNVGSYWYSDKIVLRMYKARPLSPGDAPLIHRVVEEMAQVAGIPKPRIVLIPQDAPNAFATGRNPQNAVVAVTRGIVNILDPAELKGVLGHELGHIANRDILIQTIAAVMAGAIVFIANILQWTAIFGIGGDDEDGGSPGGIGHGLPGPGRRNVDPDGHLPVPRVPGGRHGRAVGRQSPAPGRSAGQAGGSRSPGSHAGQPGHGKPVHRQPVSRARSRVAFRHPPARGRPHRPA